jgi:hypothetical protein
MRAAVPPGVGAKWRPQALGDVVGEADRGARANGESHQSLITWG